MMKAGNDYLKMLKERAKRSHVRHKHQLVGLQIAQELGDQKHKALYMKLAKHGNQAKLRWLAADVADRRGVKSRGAYFMATLLKNEKEAKEWLKVRPTNPRRNSKRKKK